MHLSLFNDKSDSASLAADLISKNLPSRLRTLDTTVRRKGLEALDPAKSDLVRIGTEVDAEGRVTKNSYGVFNLAWQAEAHPEWPAIVEKEAEEIRAAIKKAHGTTLRFLGGVWGGPLKTRRRTTKPDC